MTDTATPASIPFVTPQAARRLRARHRSETWFRFGGLAAVGVALLFVVTLLVSLGSQAVGALTQHELRLKLDVTSALADPGGQKDPQEIRMQGDFYGMVQAALLKRFPYAENANNDDALYSLVASVSAVPLADKIAVDPTLIGTTIDISLPIESDIDLFLKGVESKEIVRIGAGVATPREGIGSEWTVAVDNDVFAKELTAFRAFLGVEAKRQARELITKRLRLEDYKRDEAAAQADLDSVAGQAPAIVEARQRRLDDVANEVTSLSDEIAENERRVADFTARSQAKGGNEVLTDTTPSYFIEINGGIIKIENLGAAAIIGKAYVVPNSGSPAAAGKWTLREITTPESARRVKDDQIAFARALVNDGAIRLGPNSTIFTRSDSNEPELAGILGALVGSILTLAITFALSVPIGVFTAIYLEEFAPKNRWTDLIEVNINNLAAVPSIVFGLLGLAVFLGFFGLPRSAPLVGGLVLTLMSLPIIIIASRAALKAVPPSIREAALGVGASKVQAVFHHVLPAALPGIMTGAILGMAHALGETAPLLMIGMVAFVADVPQGFVDSATVLPVEIYMWSSRPERAWEPRTALAILSLLGFMIVMNALAVYVRRRFERRW